MKTIVLTISEAVYGKSVHDPYIGLIQIHNIAPSLVMIFLNIVNLQESAKYIYFVPFKTFYLIHYIFPRMVAMSGSTLETVLLTQTWPNVVMDTDLTTGQAGSLHLPEMLIFSKKYF
jgi:hypothetical protein